MRWDPTQYARYADERGRPFVDLLTRIDATAPRRVVDVGCGPGTLTALLAQRWPDATIDGFDSSPDMIESARAVDGVTFRVADAAWWRPSPDVDVVIANAVLQWVPNQLDLLGSWADALAPGSWLGVQVPGNFDAPSHTSMRELASAPRWRDQLGGVLRHDDAVSSPAEYAATLHDAGMDADVWETTYLHVLPGTDPVLEWVRGTGLRPVLTALSSEDASQFENEYRARLREDYPPSEHGTLFPFRRIFVVGHKR